MGFVSKDEALAKGPVVRALDEMSTGTNARQRLTTLRDQIIAAAVYPINGGTEDNRRPDFPTLTNVLKNNLLYYWSDMNQGGKLDQKKLDDTAAYLDNYWFGSTPREYAGFQTRAVYGMGLIKAIDSSLRGVSDPKPIDSYWFINCDRFELITLESVRQVTLLISTPVPVSDRYSMRTPQGACEAWVTVATDKNVGLEVFPPKLDPNKPLNPGDPAIITATGYRICTYKIVGGV